jgi:PIN domain nuclease of toxin-antitoxin system
VRFLLDANSFLWWVTSSPRLSIAARNAISDGTNNTCVAIGSLWEIAIKRSLGKLQFPHAFETVLRDERFDLLSITYAHLQTLETLPLHHRDPFDRLLIAQALTERLPIATADRRFAVYGVQLLW